MEEGVAQEIVGGKLQADDSHCTNIVETVCYISTYGGGIMQSITSCGRGNTCILSL